MCKPRRIIVVLLAVLMSGFFSAGRLVSSASALQSDQSESRIAQGLADQGQLVILPSKGKVKQSIKKEAKPFEFPTGESRALLLKLPDYSAPYTLKIISNLGRGGFGIKSVPIFVPIGVFLDAEFQPTERLSETDLKNIDPSFSTGYQIEATVLMDDARINDRYLFLYTIGEKIGSVWHTMPRRGLMKGTEVKAAETGSIELEIKPAKR
jgi:hypothetical protein